MKRSCITAVVACALVIGRGAAGLADGLIHQLPPDGTWVRFDATGDATRPIGQVIGTLSGTLTVRSVGVEQVDGTDCRWIEIETAIEFISTRGPRSKQQEAFKLLIPEKYLHAGQNPRDHVLKAWKKVPSTGMVVELNIKDGKSREVESLDEILCGAPAAPEKREDVKLEVPGGKFQCTHLKSDEESDLGDVSIQSWLTDQVPFGVAAYRHTKTRKVNAQAVGNRSLELKFAESGKDAKSTVAQP